MAESETRLDPELVSFLQMRIPTVEHLEVLLLVGSSSEHWWTVRAVNDLLRSREDSIHSRLIELAEQGLFDKAPDQDSFRLKERPELYELVARLRTAYKDYRVRVIETIYSPRSSPITEFSRAFDFKRPKGS